MSLWNAYQRYLQGEKYVSLANDDYNDHGELTDSFQGVMRKMANSEIRGLNVIPFKRKGHCSTHFGKNRSRF